MKNIKVPILIIVLILALTGCTSSSESVRQFELERNGVKSTNTLTFNGDKVIKQSTENIVQYDAAGINSKEEAEAMYGPMVEQFKNHDGLTHSIVYNDTNAVENLTIVYDEVDFDEIRNLPGMTFDTDADIKGISMKKSAELLESQGFREVK